MSTRTLSVSLCKPPAIPHWAKLKIISILGSTYTGVFESVTEMDGELSKYEKETGHFVPIHVDAASGGFVAYV